MARIILTKQDCQYELCLPKEGDFVLKTPHKQGGLIMPEDFIKINEIVSINLDDTIEINFNKAINYLINKYSIAHYKPCEELG